jgi:hypothetical protein
MRHLRPTAVILALATVLGGGPARADGDQPLGGVEWVADVQERFRPPSLHRPIGQSGQLAYAGVRIPFATGDYRARLIAAESTLGEDLQQRSSAGAGIDLYYELGRHGEIALAIERLDNTHPADQAALDSVSHVARAAVSQRLRGLAAPELRFNAEVSSEQNRRGSPGLSGVTANVIAEVAVAPAPAWELSLGLSADSARYRAPAAGSAAGRDERYGGVVLAAEHVLTPVSRLRCEAEAGTTRSADASLDGPQRQVGCSVRIDL